ncbi:7939_t:CDS:1 [Entrophospora sp. SA101]|nr:15286_t:CDS:1 [Entrophospora sp. SA101]CAJ0829107.1 7939_t:CDS:1 [Entrophospora sp. SA101]CAJ0913755.1 12902_t:CDS:1 [Entrophospora sp. SA101]
MKPNESQKLSKRRSTVLNLYQKLHQIQSQTGAISKSELNKFGKYKYFTEYQALEILKPLLDTHKLTLTFSDSPGEFTSERTEKEYLVRYLKQAILTNSEDPKEQLTFHFWAIGSNSDPAKAKGCAETYAIKYFLTKFFLIPTTDELDPDVTKPLEHLNRLKNGKQETPEQIKARHRDRDLDLLIKKHGLNYQSTADYQFG